MIKVNEEETPNNEAGQSRPEAEPVAGLVMKRFARFFGMTWPTVDIDLAWRLIHAPNTVSRKDEVYLSSVLTAYETLIHATREKRERVCKQLRRSPAFLQSVEQATPEATHQHCEAGTTE
jgi:hypothetical protein